MRRLESRFLSQINVPGLTNLSLWGWRLTAGDATAIAAALARFPVLECLEINHYSEEDEHDVYFFFDDAVRTLLSGPPLPHLRRLALSGTWTDDEVLSAVIERADKAPELNEIVLFGAFICPAALAELAAAGRGGCWPRLRRFEIFRVMIGPSDMSNGRGDVVVDECRSLLKEAWPEFGDARHEICVRGADSMLSSAFC